MKKQLQIIHGIHAVSANLEYDREHLQEVFRDKERRDQRLEKLVAALKQSDVVIHDVSRRELDKMAGSDNRHQGIVARVLVPPTLNEKDLDQLLDRLEHSPLLLILDGVTDPHNLGACLRTADACGVDAVITTRDKAVGLTATARKVSSGAAETVPFVQVTNLVRTLKDIQQRGIWIAGTAGEEATDLYATDLKGPMAIVMGAEGKGMRRLTREHCDLLVRIPMLGTVESLNVSVATAVCLYEALRQRRQVH
ncbi:MAG: 23S rRNA (guanosine(2251)-2'-O)-methyltransferase RlmB [Gammaproteobacteria bacterium]|nr:23S rRNA (guanosine(2251)-2'-O)-methyltransferase RlmB [Gammaproteobacteria bacterium]